MPGLDNTRLFMSLTAGAGTRCLVSSLFISKPPGWTGVGSLAATPSTQRWAPSTLEAWMR